MMYTPTLLASRRNPILLVSHFLAPSPPLRPLRASPDKSDNLVPREPRGHISVFLLYLLLLTAPSFHPCRSLSNPPLI
ncbi:hypothetical protein VTK73DRAFT_10056 [Phialemonium thermophilum]|uniref:Uncharacterized protein n=1 Tax=Phialemonium thermophilum TaxID=223376 RepID=A0ABR3VYX3_9PEZI